MSILANLWERRQQLSLTDVKAWEEAGLFVRSASGVRVTHETALRYGAVYACVRILSETLASLPLHVYERLERGKRRADDFYLYGLLHDRPNPLMTSVEFRSTLMSHVVTWGNGYAEIEWDRGGRALNLWPLNPAAIEKIESAGDGLIYHYREPGGRLAPIPGANMLHIRGLGADGIVGYSVISLMRQAIGLGMAAEEFGAKFFGNGANVGGVLQHPGVLGDTAYKHLRESMAEQYSGLTNAMRMMILEEGLTYQRVGIPPEDAQFLETRKFQVTDIARWFGVQPHLIADLDRSTNNNIEHQGIEFVVHTMRPWLVRWEKGLGRALLSEAERRRYFVEFAIDGLLRGDAAARSQLYTALFNVAAMSPNDIREKENMNPIPGGDRYFVQLNMAPLDLAATGAAQTAEPEQDERALPAGEVEFRAAAGRRSTLQKAHAAIYADAIGRVLRREANDVANAARRLLETRGLAEFDVWLRDFYAEQREFTQRQVEPVARAYMTLVAQEALREVGREVDEERLEAFIASYISAYAARHTTRQENRVRDLMRDGENLLQRILDETDVWRTAERALSEGSGESVRAGNAMAHTFYVLAGVTLMRWAAIGKTCPFCRDLDGRVVGVTEVFLPAGLPFQPEGAETPLVTSSNVSHPPAHRGCDCMIQAYGQVGG